MGDTYHHGDLRAALLEEAMEMLEGGETFSLRAVARRAGVSRTAPYRHFENRQALESALAAVGLRELLERMTSYAEKTSSVDDLAEFGVIYVRFALERPALFRLMFGSECDTESEERVSASAKIHMMLEDAMREVFPMRDTSSLASAGWAMAHGFAFLHLEGKLPAEPRDEVDSRVRTAFLATLGIQTE